MQWIQVLAEGWATPLSGFMRERELWLTYSCLVHFQLDMQWVQVLAEGWATPLSGFMRERELWLTYSCLVHLRNECLFFRVHGVWIVARDKQIAWTAKRFSCDLFVPRYDSYPMNPEKKTLIPYIYNVSNKDSFLNSPRKVINLKFAQ